MFEFPEFKVVAADVCRCFALEASAKTYHYHLDHPDRALNPYAIHLVWPNPLVYG